MYSFLFSLNRCNMGTYRHFTEEVGANHIGISAVLG